MKRAKFARRPSCDLRVLCGALLLFAGLAVAQEATQKPRIICDHAAPPRGMHYVCKSQCDCHLEGKLKNDEDGIVAAPPAELPTKVCTYKAPKKGGLLVCDSECTCKDSDGATATVSNGVCKQPLALVVPIVYPAIARANRLEGIVYVQVEIDNEGQVVSSNAVEGHRLLAQAVEDSVKKWHFDPDCSHAQMVDVRFRLSLNDDLDKPGFYLHPPDEVEVVGKKVVINDTLTRKKKRQQSNASTKPATASK